jgi:ribonuclease R
MARRPPGSGPPHLDGGREGAASPRARRVRPPGASAPHRRPKAPAVPAPLPSKEQLRRFLATAPGRVGKTEIARHFGLTSDQRPALRTLLASLKAEGSATPAGRCGVAAGPAPEGTARPGRLPEMAVVEVTGTDADGDPIARPAGWRAAEQGRPPVVFMQPEARGQAALAPGQKVLARLRPIGPGKYEGRTVKRIADAGPGRVLGVFEEGRIIPTDRRSRAEWAVPAGETAGAEPGEIVLAEPLPSHRTLGPRPARIVERLGRFGEPRSVSLICIHAHGIPDVFPAEALSEAERARAVAARGREDLRRIPLVTIDGEDARDFDDAVWAEPDGDGWRVLVAIADVAHYVRPDGALDREAWARGNSVYFPDRVVPMLPEALSNGWCSLRPGENRGCLFVEMRLDSEGRKTGHRFGRGIMWSAARLTYEAVQAAQDAGTDPEGLAPGHIRTLYGAFRALLAARERRGTLDLDLPERRVLLDARGNVAAVVPRPRLDSHRLIEEFMVAANVCAAEELERLGHPCMYRIHDRPSGEKLEGLRQFLSGLGITLPPSNHLQPRNFAAVLARVRGRPEERLVNETVLRSQSQAAYSPDNIGHFGLALPRYAHFTSPIRRYADLLVHRALIRGLRLGAGGLEETEAARFPDSAEHITQTERRAAAAERDAVDRYLAAYMAQHVGEAFEARISGVTRFGLFVTVEENGASGIVPLGSLPDDRWIEDQATHSLAGQRTGLRFTLGQAVDVLLAQATPRTGGMVFHLMQGDVRGGSRPGGRRPPGSRAAAPGRSPAAARGARAERDGGAPRPGQSGGRDSASGGAGRTDPGRPGRAARGKGRRGGG